jgi:predicted dehydrogenase
MTMPANRNLSNLKVLVVGSGSIGARHIRNLINLGVTNIAVCDSNQDQLTKVQDTYKIKEAYTDFSGALKQGADAVVVCTPTATHVSVAVEAAKKSCHVFIEKPLSDTMELVDELIEKMSENKKVLMIGFNFRFHPCMQKIKSLLLEGKIGKVIILDAIHELDYIRWFMGEVSEVFCYADKLSNLEMDTEDTAEMLLRFNSKAIGNIHMDYVQRTYNRQCEIIGDQGTITWNFNDNIVRLYRAVTGQWQLFNINDGKKLDFNETYLEEMACFLDCVKGTSEPPVDGIEGKRIQQVAIAAKTSAETGQVVRL